MGNVTLPNGVTRSSLVFQEANLTANGENQYSHILSVDAGERVSVSVSGKFDATVTVERMLDSINWRAVPNQDGTVGWTAPTEQTYEADEACFLRIGIATGAFSSGEAICRLGKG